MRKWRQTGLTAVVLGALAVTGGCIPGYIRVNLSVTREANGGAPLYMVVRNIELKPGTNQEPTSLMDIIVRNTQTRQTAGQSYGEIVSLLDAPDGSVVRARFLHPGRTYRFYLKAPNNGPLGMYFLFANPGGTWNLILDQPLPWQLHATLHENHVSQQLAK